MVKFSKKYSALSLAVEALRGHVGWKPAWRNAEPKRQYDMVLIGGGGHGLATAYYLAKVHGYKNIAVLEKGWIGGGNSGRNTTIVRSNYFFPESTAFYDFSLKLYEGLSRELNYNVMFSQRGMMMLAHDRHGVEMLRRSANAMLLNGADAEFLSPHEVRARVPGLNPSPRFPIMAGLNQPRGGSARHDAVVWGYARAADALGVDIIQGCEVTGFGIENGQVNAVETSRGRIETGKVGVAVAGHSSMIAQMAGFNLPIISYALQAYVSEPLKPCLDTVLLSPATGVYVSQSDKGGLVIGSSLDLYPSYAQRGNLPTMEASAAGIVELFPQFSRVKFLRQWAGIVDVMHDSTPVVGKTPVKGLYFNCGWGTGGFKAIPGGGYCFAHTMANDEPHPLVAPFSLKRFETGRLIDEAAGAGIAH
ncbi:sarcosine oxidase subunit beta family protein [Kordiimonas pumila]|uniref:Sarcosine oxidase subunit beta n=1 Tax=Kordiimonas pumila TaxID=2161677 RepID=A0ABV7D8J0_9PROT|nr:sarcosine oxidase subunit beta family protein [Kordiimonas pumila]